MLEYPPSAQQHPGRIRSFPIPFSTLGLLILCLGVAQAFATNNIYPTGGKAFVSKAAASPMIIKTSSKRSSQRNLLKIRGGGIEVEVKDNDAASSDSSSPKVSSSPKASILPVASMFAALGKLYGSSLETRPILTKSVTACLIFGLSDYLAQKLESRGDASTTKLNRTRLLTSMGVGLLYFGPAAHYWYSAMFKIFPGTGLFSTLQKSAMGQLLFGPSFTCIFFATGLWQAGQFTVGNWLQKIRQDLPGAWLAGVGFWPLVDLVSYSLIPVQYIPLFVNMCSLVWTIYLSGVANRESRTE